MGRREPGPGCGAWERRYELLEPARMSGGLRLYSPADERRVRDMQAGLRRGLGGGGSRAAPSGDVPEEELGLASDAVRALGGDRRDGRREAPMPRSTGCWPPSRCRRFSPPW